MLGSILNSQSLQVARQALDGLSQREEAIASNIANIDTPGYQRKVVNFEDALQAQLNTGQPGIELKRTDPRHLSAPANGNSLPSGTQAQDVVASRNDNNNVDIDQEMTQLVDTQLRYQALSSSLGTRLATLRTVINGT